MIREKISLSRLKFSRESSNRLEKHVLWMEDGNDNKVMAKEIKITIVTDDDKMNMTPEGKKEVFAVLTHDSSTTLMSTLRKSGLISGGFCGGRGDCGRCKVQFVKGGPLPTALERSVLEAEELRQGYRLSCLARPKDDCVIRLALSEEPKIAILSNMMDMPQKYDHFSQQNEMTISRKAGVSEMEEDPNVADVMIAVDLGTTTVVMQLIEIQTGCIRDTFCSMNPQRCYGADVLSRIKASCEGHREVLQRMIGRLLEQGVEQFCIRGDKLPIRAMCIAGNTTMEHLIMGYDVSCLGSSPFTPVTIGWQEYEYPEWDFPVWILPGVSTFVGGDIVAGLYALNLIPAGALQETALLIDLGTNGEIALTDGKRMIVTATAAGPAFEGGAETEIVGSDMVANTAFLLRQGLVDETGLLQEPYFTEGIDVGRPAVRIRNKDIRNLQMAKAAVRAGIEILWKEMGCPEIKKVYLAGGFGYYLDVEAAFCIGLLPEHMRGRVTAVGNTSLAGAYHIGCDLLHGKIDRREMEEELSAVLKINLAEQEEFETLYMRYMNLQTNDFPQKHKAEN